LYLHDGIEENMSQVLTISAGSGDCYGSTSLDLVTGSTTLFLDGTPTIGEIARTWIPFTVALPKNLVIVSAFVKWYATQSRSESSGVSLGCEAADNPSTPSSRADLFARSLTAAFNSVVFESYTTGNQYSYDITSAVQEVLNRSGWVSGNTMAVLAIGAINNDNRRQIASVENVTYQEPILEIIIPTFFPRSSGVI
jgi:hypothetical protein